MKFELLSQTRALAISLQLLVGRTRKSGHASERPEFVDDPQGHPDAEVVVGKIPFGGSADSKLARLKAKLHKGAPVVPIDLTDNRFYSDDENTPFKD